MEIRLPYDCGVSAILIEQIRILVVEDDEVGAQVARLMLERLGCLVDVADNGVDAIELFRKGSYHLVFMDWQMPVMDGFEATAWIRRLPRGRETSIIGTTANRSRSECLAAGMNDIMPKPFLLENMKLELSKWTHWNENLNAKKGA